MGDTKKLVLGILGALWAFFLVAITITPHDAWEHLVAWWAVIITGLGWLAVWQAKVYPVVAIVRSFYIWRNRRRTKS
jgi:hypothetical protein